MVMCGRLISGLIIPSFWVSFVNFWAWHVNNTCSSARVPHFITPLKQKRLPLGLLIDYSDYSERKHNEKQKKSAESTLKVPVHELNMPGQNGSDCSKIPH